MITLSIVSHGQVKLVNQLLLDIEKYGENTPLEIILTLNIPENMPDSIPQKLPVQIIKNNTPKGFGANHNAAFLKSTGDYFCVLNPDIRLIENPFPVLLKGLLKKNIGVTGPLIIDNNNTIQDSARDFLTLPRLLKRVLFKKNTPDSTTNTNTDYPDWIAGMFMVFKKDVYENIQGFDERYFLYCEDMDICKRLHTKKLKVYYEKNTRVIHDAQRNSHKNLKYLYWHLKSLFRYFFKDFTSHAQTQKHLK